MDKLSDSRAETIADVAKTGGTIVSSFSLAKSIFVCGLFAILLIVAMSQGLPLYIGLPFIAFLILILVLNAIRVKRIASAKI